MSLWSQINLTSWFYHDASKITVLYKIGIFHRRWNPPPGRLFPPLTRHLYPIHFNWWGLLSKEHPQLTLVFGRSLSHSFLCVARSLSLSLCVCVLLFVSLVCSLSSSLFYLTLFTVTYIIFSGGCSVLHHLLAVSLVVSWFNYVMKEISLLSETGWNTPVSDRSEISNLILTFSPITRTNP